MTIRKKLRKANTGTAQVITENKRNKQPQTLRIEINKKKYEKIRLQKCYYL
jgi:hypothetical protein